MTLHFLFSPCTWPSTFSFGKFPSKPTQLLFPPLSFGSNTSFLWLSSSKIWRSPRTLRTRWRPKIKPSIISSEFYEIWDLGYHWCRKQTTILYFQILAKTFRFKPISSFLLVMKNTMNMKNAPFSNPIDFYAIFTQFHIWTPN